MSDKTYRAIHLATGTVGKVSLRHFIENPVTELVGVLVINPDNVGRDAREFIGRPATGELATDGRGS